MITIHHLDDSRSQRILWLLEELGQPYEIIKHKRDPGTRLAPAALKAVHPLGKSPVIEDDNRVVAESGAIIDYILRRYGDGRLQQAAFDPHYDQYVHWMHYAEGSAMPALIIQDQCCASRCRGCSYAATSRCGNRAATRLHQ